MHKARIDLKALSQHSAAELLPIWRRHLNTKAPDHLPKSLLLRLLAYELQVENEGGHSKKALSYLKAIGDDLRQGHDAQTPYEEQRHLKSGSVLVQEHQGVLHRVVVQGDRFEWRDQTYASLSAVAKAITGTNWNCHRFFGLKGKVKAAQQTSKHIFQQISADTHDHANKGDAQ